MEDPEREAQKARLAEVFFKNGPYPRDGYIEIGEVDLVGVDSSMAGLLATFFSNEQSLTPDRARLLEENTANLEKCHEQMPPQAREHFCRTIEVARGVLLLARG